MLWLILWGVCAVATIVFTALELWKLALIFGFLTWFGSVLLRALTEGRN